LNPLTGSTGTRAVKVVDPIDGGTYYIEYRAPVGTDATSAEFHYADQCDTAVHGYRICHLGSPSTGVIRILKVLPNATDGANGTTVLATSLMPGSTNKTTRNTRLAVGHAFTNYDAGFTVTVNSLSVSRGASVTVAFPAATSTAVSAALSTRTYGTDAAAPVTVHVGTAGGSTPVGVVTLYDGTVAIGKVSVDGKGNATFSLPATLVAGTHTITAKFTPSNQAFTSSASAPSKVVVARATSTIAVALSSVTATQKSRLQAVVTVRAPGIASPTGTITVYADGKSIATAEISSADHGRHTVVLPAFATRGTRTITVSYLGTANLAGVTSTGTLVTVN
jgi:Bacterial Ig-like domain (group 3)